MMIKILIAIAGFAAVGAIVTGTAVAFDRSGQPSVGSAVARIKKPEWEAGRSSLPPARNPFGHWLSFIS